MNYKHFLLTAALLAVPVFSFAASDPDGREAKIQKILSQMTLEEKVSLCSGNGGYKGVPRLGIPNVNLTDGPRGPHGDNSTGFPCGIGMAATWNPALMEAAGRVMGEETRSFGCSVLLGPLLRVLLRGPVPRR